MGFLERIILARRSRFVDRLSEDPQPSPHDWRLPWILAGLVVLCLVPRLLMLLRLGAVCNDAYYYIYVADALRQREFDTAFAYLNLNIYPVILLLLHNLGLDWETAGKLWGALISSLLVLPMFGWVRRLFDVRVAVASCFLYAVHPNLIEVSVEPIRDATCWFFFTLCLYLTWRAVTENRLWLYLATGFTLALGLHTRVECWFLLVPLLQWSFFRWLSFPEGRRRMLAGLAVCLAVTPLLVVTANVTVLRDHDRWEFGRLSHFNVFSDWLRSDGRGIRATIEAESLESESDGSSEMLVSVGPPSAIQSGKIATDVGQPPTSGEIDADEQNLAESPVPSKAAKAAMSYRLQTYLKSLLQTLEAANLILMAIGLVRWRYLTRHRDKSVLIALCGAVLLAIWIRLTQIGSMNGRYFLIIFFIGTPFQALGLLYALRRVALVGRWIAPVKLATAAPAAAAVVLIATTGWVDALTTVHIQRESHVSFGRWLKTNCGGFDSVIADLGATRAGYYAKGTLPDIIPPHALLGEEYDDHPPDLLIFSNSYIDPDQRMFILERARQLGLIRIESDSMPHTKDGFIVMMRSGPAGRIARQLPGHEFDAASRR